MDFALPHIHEDSVVTSSNIRHVPLETPVSKDDAADDTQQQQQQQKEQEPPLDDMLIEAANQAAIDLFFGLDSGEDPTKLDCTAYPERSTPQSETIQPGALVVIFESFDNLNFCYAKVGEIFRNRNGEFYHDDFIGKPFGCKIRSRNNRGLGYLYLLKPTPELWARSLKHRTQIVHELDASMIVFYLNIRPNMVVCESGTGSGALSHCIMRTIAPGGMLHTYEFNQQRADTARVEFEKNRVSHLVTVHHKDVCGKHGPGGFDRPQASVDAVVLDLPEPWNAVPYAAHCLKPGGRLASYSPCVEQSQRTVTALQGLGFHTIKTMEFRLKEYYVDDEELELPPKEKRQRIVDKRQTLVGTTDGGAYLSGQDTGTETDPETRTSRNATEGDPEIVLTTTTAGTTNEDPSTVSPAAAAATEGSSSSGSSKTPKRKKFLVARPFVTMRGHTAFLTFATAGNKLQPLPK
ncbi:tRNA1-methyladenosine methyltransferase-like methyltransferase [Nitzschia inconspicua]|uniref:tRNA1-methyladenosine methyltransferase-like methyltransferase n=1 Tax=Nitzschia inconspicua TaxID=303405 RepID=A0A9K3LYK6_9STRA|nr:tRNA1-methyladenosine methyltransferase-like methyltransferase [Nitzschia inconspicua]